jgi:hypothetical protein
VADSRRQDSTILAKKTVGTPVIAGLFSIEFAQEAAVEQLQRLTRHRLDLYRGLQHPPENVGAALRGFPAALRKRLGAAAAALAELQRSLGRGDVTGK